MRKDRPDKDRRTGEKSFHDFSPDSPCFTNENQDFIARICFYYSLRKRRAIVLMGFADRWLQFCGFSTYNKRTFGVILNNDHSKRKHH